MGSSRFPVAQIRPRGLSTGEPSKEAASRLDHHRHPGMWLPYPQAAAIGGDPWSTMNRR
jgi:hypothetical protein